MKPAMLMMKKSYHVDKIFTRREVLGMATIVTKRVTKKFR